MSIRLIEEHKSYRITEDRDEDLNMTHLKGDMFTLKCKEEMQPGKSEEEILAAEKAFEREV